ncbi:MSMEG_1061 family FMN-dependent PPOX-type flavoprotein [Paenibacillus puerhi]|uniref:MSMEG_1061 family FMN-dependent PPOX-type flavoprotein n=1 Tax=Paenibacillus puerhi TaxID=2692622 RepID=UPI0013576DB3|nr:MSMEG_1061 family FMN-dependent PPOX-type flavoprotein [Paenibacillus puerhi]
MEAAIPFASTISSREELRTLVGEPHEAVVKKSVAQIDSHIRGFIAKSPLFFLSTSGKDGQCDVSPRGDAPGFVTVLDDSRLLYPERPGNRRIDSLLNLLDNPHVGMLFVIPGMEEVMRINGRAWITRDEELLGSLQAGGKAPQLAVGVEVEECFIHCPRALKQARAWERPSSLDMFRAHVKLNGLILPET